MLQKTLPSELLKEITTYIQNDYTTLYSCILVNKLWHHINISTLWRNPLYSTDSIKILINCLLIEDKEFLKNNNIELRKFQPLENPPLYNYANFATDLKFWEIDNKFTKLIGDYNPTTISLLKKRLIDFILDYSKTIRILKTTSLDYGMVSEWSIDHPRFSICFQNLCELQCRSFDNNKLFDKLTQTCKNIQVLKLRHNDFNNGNDYNLAQLIKAQNQIKELAISALTNLNLSAELRSALLIHSESIIEYSSDGGIRFDHLLIPTLKNLKCLKFFNYKNIHTKYLRSVLLPKIEIVEVFNYKKLFLLDLSEFIENNGKNLITINIDGNINYSRELLNSIEQKCHNLEDLRISYNNNLDQKLIEIINYCKKLKYIELRKLTWNSGIDGDKTLEVLNQSLPKNLYGIDFEKNVTFSNGFNNSSVQLPFRIKLFKK